MNTKHEDKYLFTKDNMPIVYETAQKILEVTDKKIALSLPLTWETLSLIDAIKEKIPNLMVIPQSSGYSSSTQDGVFLYLKKWNVKYWKTAKDEDRIELLKQNPDIIVDCSLVLCETALKYNLLPKETIIIEDTKTGENRIEEIHINNPYIILDNGSLKREYENRFGIGYSVIAALMSLGFFLPKYKIGIIGYGKVGEGVARFARGLGCTVLVCEIDKGRAESAKEFCEVVDKNELLKRSNIVITAAGKNVLRREDFINLDKTIYLANAGGEDEWIREELFGKEKGVRIHPHIEEYIVEKCKIREAGEGNSLNLAVGISVSSFLDVTFSHLILILERVLHVQLKNGKNDIDIVESKDLIEKMKSEGSFRQLSGSLWQWTHTN